MTTAAATLLAWEALLERDLRALLRSRSQLYSSILLPLIFLAILGSGVSEGLEPSLVRDGDYASFLVPGIIAMTALFSATFSGASYYQDRDRGILKALLASPHPPAVILLGKSLAGVVVGCLQALLVLAITVSIPAIDLDWQYGVGPGLVLAVIAILLLNLLLGGFAHLLSTRIGTLTGFHLVMNLVLFPLFFLSGAFFLLDDVPVWLQALGRANPLSYAVDLLHVAIYADTTSGYLGLAIDVPVLLALTTAFLYLGTRPLGAPWAGRLSGR